MGEGSRCVVGRKEVRPWRPGEETPGRRRQGTVLAP